VTLPRLFRLLVSAFLALSLQGCGSGKDKAEPEVQVEQLAAISGDQTWMYGDWHLQGTPASFSDMGADIRVFHISKEELWIEKFGHLAAESSLFNTEGYDYGGNCLYRAHGTRFGFKVNANSHQSSLSFFRDRFELLDDPGNHADCATQIKRINDVIQREHYSKEIGPITHGVDEDSLKLDPQFMMHQTGELKRYLRM
jgi:hypothetical protein